MALINIRIEKVIVEQDPEIKELLKRIADKLSEDDKLREKIMAKLNNIISDVKSTV